MTQPAKIDPIAQPDVFRFEKDINGKYTYCNENFARLAQLDSPNQAVGLYDEDFHWRKQAPFFHQVRNTILAGGRWDNRIQPLILDTKTVNILISISQTCDDQGAPTGLSAYFIHLNNIQPATVEMKNDQPANRFYLGDYYKESLSASELRVLKYILQGKSNAQTANLCHLSKRTVDDYVEKIKLKFQVDSKLQLIAEAYQSGIAFLIL